MLALKLKASIRGLPGAWVLLLAALAAHDPAQAAPVCRQDDALPTANGVLRRLRCTDTEFPTIDRWELDGQLLLQGPYPIGRETRDDSKRLYVLSSASSPRTHCTENLFLLDLSTTQPRVFRFGVRHACNDYHWASWGKQRSVIAIKNNVRFVYANGRLTPPRHDVALMEKLQFSAYGGSNVFEEIVPFAEEITPAAPDK